MIVTNLAGESELLVDYSGLKRTRKVNGDYSLSFAILKTDKNEHAFPLAEEESIVEYDSQQYRIKDVTEVLVGITPIKTVQATHIFFDLVDTYKYDYLENTQTLQSCLTFALDGTGCTFEVIDSFPNAVFEKFGEDNSLSLVQKALNVFGAEVQINNEHLKLYRQIGTETEIQIRYGYNIKTLEKYVNTNNLSTYIKGYGKKNEDGSYVVTAEYTSPNAHLHKDENGNVKLKHAKPVYDERYTVYEELLARIKSELIDEPQVSFKVDALELKKMGVLTEQLNEGDRVFVIYEPLGIDLIARVLEIVDYPESAKPAEYTFGNFRNNFTSEMAGFQKTKDNVDAILNGEQKLPYNALDDAVLRATEALQSAATELIFDNGIIARDPKNPNRLVLINSKGIGISDNGGATFREAITADGFVLSAGAIGTLSANHISTGILTGVDIQSPTSLGGLIRINEGVLSNVYSGSKISIISKVINGRPRSLLELSDAETGTTSEIIQAGKSLELYCDAGTINIGAHLSTNMTGSAIVGGDLIVSKDTTISEDLNVTGNTQLKGSFNVLGSKNCVVKTSQGLIAISAYETAEYYFGDIGRGEVVDGQCVVEIESLFKETVNTNIDYEVFVTPYGKGLIYVDEMNPDYFVVKGDDIPFAYEIKAKRIGYEDVRLDVV